MSTRERCRFIGRTFSHVSVVYVVPITLISLSIRRMRGRVEVVDSIESNSLVVLRLVIAYPSVIVDHIVHVIYWSPSVTTDKRNCLNIDHFQLPMSILFCFLITSSYHLEVPDHFQLLFARSGHSTNSW